jgi:hypothetical protein
MHSYMHCGRCLTRLGVHRGSKRRVVDPNSVSSVRRVACQDRTEWIANYSAGGAAGGPMTSEASLTDRIEVRQCAQCGRRRMSRVA